MAYNMTSLFPKELQKDIFKVVLENRSIKTRIEKLIESGYQVFVNDHFKEVCQKVGDKTTRFQGLGRYRSGCKLGSTFLKKLSGRNSEYVWFIQVSKKIGVEQSFRYTQLTYFVIIPALNIEGYLRKLKLRKIERNSI